MKKLGRLHILKMTIVYLDRMFYGREENVECVICKFNANSKIKEGVIDAVQTEHDRRKV